MNEVADALITIQNDLFSCKSVTELNTMYINYQNVLKKLYFKAMDELLKEKIEFDIDAKMRSYKQVQPQSATSPFEEKEEKGLG